jgi:biopolymer transport protein ExbD
MNLRRRHRKEYPIPRLPLIALIDVVLFLLLYFMLAGSLSPVESNLATALRTQGGGASRDLPPQVVSVSGAGGKSTYRIGDRILGTRDELAEVLARLPKQAGVVVRVAGDAPVAAAAAAIQAAKDAGFVKVSYVPAKQ